MAQAQGVTRWGITGILLLFLSLIITPVPAAPSGNLDDGIRWGPWITATTGTSTIVNWRSEGAVAGAVEYSPRPELFGTGLSSSAEQEVPSTFHRIRIENLSPSTTYFYRVTSGNETSRTWMFSTFPETGRFSFVVYGDTRDQIPLYTQDERHRLVAEQIGGEEGILFVLNTGDLVQDGENTNDWDRFFSAAGTLLPTVTYYPVMGNHEENSTLYYDIFGFPPVYSFTCGEAKMVVLDSNLWASDTLLAQAAWMNREFGGWEGWKFAAFHYPIYSSPEGHVTVRKDLRDAWEPVLIGQGVSAVFTGHVHAYERYEVDGIHHFVLATGGAPSYPLSPDKPPGNVASIENTLGYAVVTIDPEESMMVIRYVEVARVEGRSVVQNGEGIIKDWVVLRDAGSDQSPKIQWPVQELSRCFPGISHSHEVSP